MCQEFKISYFIQRENALIWFFAFYASKLIEIASTMGIGHRSICLLNAVLLIPVLLWFMTFYVIRYMS